MESYFSKGIEDLEVLAKQLIPKFRIPGVVCFYGEMGAGKTTLIKQICKELGVKDSVFSPTYTLVNEYEYNGKPLYHFDFYRINEESEAFDMGYEDYFFSDGLCLVEWPEKIENLIPEDAIKVKITLEGEKRKIEIGENIN